MESGAVYIAPIDLSTGSRTGSRDGTAPQSGVSTSDGGTPRTSGSQERGGGTGTEASSDEKVNHSQDGDWVSDMARYMCCTVVKSLCMLFSAQINKREMISQLKAF